MFYIRYCTTDMYKFMDSFTSSMCHMAQQSLCKNNIEGETLQSVPLTTLRVAMTFAVF